MGKVQDLLIFPANKAKIQLGIDAEIQMGEMYLVVGPQIHWDGLLGLGVDRAIKVERPDEVHRIQHLQVIYVLKRFG